MSWKFPRISHAKKSISLSRFAFKWKQDLPIR